MVEMARTVRADLRPEVDRLIRYGLERVAGLGVEVHVRVARPRVAWVLVAPTARRHRGCRLTRTAEHDWLKARGLWPAGAATVLYGWSSRRADLAAEAGVHAAVPTRVELRRDRMRGLAYDGIPRLARTRPGAKYLVTVKIPAAPDQEPYPLTSVYRKSVPVELTSWQHNLLHIAAHEGCHVWQFEHGLSRSEVEAERWGLEVADLAIEAGLLPAGGGPSRLGAAYSSGTAVPDEGTAI
jgi:hypothetical protein